MSLVCPKCQGKMRNLERDGVTVDVCKQCRGVFLDRAELERLMVAEAQFFGLAPAEPAASPIVDYDRPQRPAKESRRDYDKVRPDKLRGKKKQKRAFLEDFFD